jgi:hypothetical protein
MPRTADNRAQVSSTRMRRQSRRKASMELSVLSIAIVLGLIGFAVHTLWVLSIVLMALLWGVAASELSRMRGGAPVSEVVSGVIDDARKTVDEVAADVSETVGTAEAEEPRPGPIASSNKAGDDSEPTKKELYEEARDAGIEGRSSMNKDELREALEE